MHTGSPSCRSSTPCRTSQARPRHRAQLTWTRPVRPPLALRPAPPRPHVSPCTAPKLGAVSVTNHIGWAATDCGIPLLPPAVPACSRCHTSPLYSRLHDGQTEARRFPHRSSSVPSGSPAVPYSTRGPPGPFSLDPPREWSDLGCRIGAGGL